MQSEYSRKMTALNKDNFETMNKITKYFVSFIIDKADYNRMIDDLLDLTLENQEQGIFLRDIIGRDVKVFRDKLVKNHRIISIIEKTVFYTFIYSVAFSVLFLVSYIIFLDQTVPMEGIMNITPLLSDLISKIAFVIVFLVMIFCIFRFSFKSQYKQILIYMFSILLIGGINRLAKIIFNDTVISFNSLYITLLFAAIASILYLIRLMIVKKSRLAYRK